MQTRNPPLVEVVFRLAYGVKQLSKGVALPCDMGHGDGEIAESILLSDRVMARWGMIHQSMPLPHLVRELAVAASNVIAYIAQQISTTSRLNDAYGVRYIKPHYDADFRPKVPPPLRLHRFPLPAASPAAIPDCAFWQVKLIDLPPAAEVCQRNDNERQQRAYNEPLPHPSTKIINTSNGMRYPINIARVCRIR